jgi:hypothetical protein
VRFKRWIFFERRLEAQSFDGGSVLAKGYQGEIKLKRLVNCIGLAITLLCFTLNLARAELVTTPATSPNPGW